jgi:tight adherence protein C
MDALFDILRALAGDDSALQVMFVVIAAATIFVLVLGISFLVMSATDPIRRRIGGIAAREEVSGGHRRINLQTMLGPVAAYILPSNEIERSQTTRRLVHAGFRSPSALQTFYALKTVLAIALPLLVLIIAQFFPAWSTLWVAVYVVIASAVGVLAPSVVLDKLLAKRMKKLRDGFPDALDLMVVCVEAGLGISQAIQRVADELVVSHPELAMELSLVNAEIRAGVDRVTALKNLSERTGLDDIRGLVSLLVQTLRFGTSVSDSLRVYSEEFRDKRMQKAEEVAATMGTKMMFPLIVFLFPGFFVVAVGPAAIQLMSVFGQM